MFKKLAIVFVAVFCVLPLKFIFVSGSDVLVSLVEVDVVPVGVLLVPVLPAFAFGVAYAC